MCVFKDTNVISKSSTVMVQLINSVFKSNYNVISGIPPLQDIGPNICYLPLIGAGGLSLLFNQSYKVTFLCLGNLVWYCGGTIAGNMLILYTNGMYNSQAIIKRGFISHGFLIPRRNAEVIGSGITVLSVLCGTCPAVSNSKRTWVPLNIKKSTVTWSGSNEFHVIKSGRVHYGGGIYLNIMDACGPKFTVIELNNIFRDNYAYISGSNLYAFVIQTIKKLKDLDISLVLKNIEVYGSLKQNLVHGVFSKVPSITLINWNSVTIHGGQFHDNN